MKDLARANKSIWEIHTQLPRRSLSAVTGKVYVIRQELGSGTRKQSWADDEKSRLLKAKVSGLSWVSVRAMFPNRTFSAIRASYDRAAAKLRQRNVTTVQSCVTRLGEQEIDQIIRLRDQDSMTFLKIAQGLGRSPTQVRNEPTLLIERPRRPWLYTISSERGRLARHVVRARRHACVELRLT